MGKLHIFKKGTHTDLHGRKREYTPAELKASAAAYDPQKWRAPIVVGHPKTDNPAYGYVDSLVYADGDADGLFAEPADVMAEFADAVKAKRYTGVSASFWLPDAPRNPVPGALYLRHVGFLGAVPPAIPGLQPVEFGADDTGVVEFSDFGQELSAGVFRRLREWLLAKFGATDADQVVPNWLVDTVLSEAQTRAPEQSVPETALAFAAPAAATGDASPLQAEVDRLTAELAARQAADQSAASAATHREHVAFADGLVSAGKLPPKHAAVVVSALDALRADTPLEFGEGEERQPLLPALQAVLQELPTQVSFTDVATPETVVAAARRIVNPLVADAERRAEQSL
ncbi:MAG: hypothetical protein U0973_13560 [Xanthomonadaceae bacterium]|nr:hypothetical protein [Xanthomonadaceae bacterium]